MRFFGYAIIITIVLALFSSYGRGEEDKALVATVDADGVQKVEIVAGSYFFKPEHIIVKAQAPVELKVRKESGIAPHNFVINAPEAGINISENLSTEPVIITFTPTKTGEYHFYCDKKLPFAKSHREKGMVGTIEVIQ